MRALRLALVALHLGLCSVGVSPITAAPVEPVMTLSSLPGEMFEHVVEHLDPCSTAKFRMTCRRFRGLISVEQMQQEMMERCTEFHQTLQDVPITSPELREFRKPTMSSADSRNNPWQAWLETVNIVTELESEYLIAAGISKYQLNDPPHQLLNRYYTAFPHCRQQVPRDSEAARHLFGSRRDWKSPLEQYRAGFRTVPLVAQKLLRHGTRILEDAQEFLQRNPRWYARVREDSAACKWFLDSVEREIYGDLPQSQRLLRLALLQRIVTRRRSDPHLDYHMKRTMRSEISAIASYLQSNRWPLPEPWPAWKDHEGRLWCLSRDAREMLAATVEPAKPSPKKHRSMPKPFHAFMLLARLLSQQMDHICGSPTDFPPFTRAMRLARRFPNLFHELWNDEEFAVDTFGRLFIQVLTVFHLAQAHLQVDMVTRGFFTLGLVVYLWIHLKLLRDFQSYPPAVRVNLDGILHRRRPWSAEEEATWADAEDDEE